MATDRVTKIQNRLQIDSFSEEIFREEADALTALDNALTLYDSFLRDKCRIRWLEGGTVTHLFTMGPLRDVKLTSLCPL